MFKPLEYRKSFLCIALKYDFNKELIKYFNCSSLTLIFILTEIKRNKINMKIKLDTPYI